MAATKVFISHASDDKKIADALTNFLVTGVDIARRKIRNTSDHQLGLAKGADIATALRKDIKKCLIFIPLITPRSLRQSWVLIEIAAWAFEKEDEPKVFPVLFARRKPKLPDVIEKRLHCDLANVDDLIKFAQDLALKIFVKKDVMRGVERERRKIAAQAFLSVTKALRY